MDVKETSLHLGTLPSSKTMPIINDLIPLEKKEVIATAIPPQALSQASKEIIPPALPNKYGV